jgi:hypothetical protein
VTILYVSGVASVGKARGGGGVAFLYVSGADDTDDADDASEGRRGGDGVAIGDALMAA